jgi:peptide/nickel transport system ATP-binding protein
MTVSVATSQSPPPAGSTALLDVRNLTVSFETRTGPVTPVRDISFRVGAGQRLGLVGESGSGKSLTALALMRLIHPPGRVGGQVLLNGRDVLRLEGRELARLRGGQVAMIYQDPMSALNPVQTIGRQVVEAIRLHMELSPRAARDRAAMLLADVGLQDPLRRMKSYPHEFSGGMRQRVMIAMAMSADPVLLIADEPTTALDVTTQALVLETLGRLVDERGSAVILITHDLGVAAGFCDEIQVMYAGRLVERASAAHLFRDPVHPYSEALLRSICDLDADVATALPAIPGQPPLPSALPSGCSFHPRCLYALDVCRTVEPTPLFIAATGGMAECHRAEERIQGLVLPGDV